MESNVASLILRIRLEYIRRSIFSQTPLDPIPDLSQVHLPRPAGQGWPNQAHRSGVEFHTIALTQASGHLDGSVYIAH